MKKILLFVGLTVFLAACSQEAEDVDPNFDNFYQGTPQDFTVEDNAIKDEVEAAKNNEKSFTIQGESDDYSCEFICTEK